MSEHVKILKEGRVTTLRLDRPAKKNALDGAMYRALADGLAKAGADPDTRALVLTGHPDVFCAGNDLADFARVRESGAGLSAGDFLGALVACPLPIVAAVSGWAVGIGTTMLLHCDLVFASPTARFRTPFVDLGLCPEGASSVLLPATVGPRVAVEMLYLGTTVDAARGKAIGLVTDVVDDPLARATEVAATLAAKAPGALRATKALLRRVDRATIESALAAERDAFLTQLRGPEAQEAAMAMLQKRAPRFD